MKKLRQTFGSLKNLGLSTGSDSTNSADGIHHTSPNRRHSVTTNPRTIVEDGSYVNYDAQSLGAEASVVNYIDPLRTVDSSFTKLHKWSYLGDLSKVKKFIRKIDVNAKDKNGRICLHLCANEGHIDVLLFLLCAGANAEIKDNDGRTPLLKAAERGYFSIVQILLKHKVDFCVKDNMNNSALHIAAQSGSKELIELFLELGLGNQLRNSSGQTPLHLASLNDHIDAAKALVSNDCIDINAQDKEGVTPVMLAVKRGCRPLVDILIDSGADLILQDCSGWNAHSYAKYSAYSELHEYLSSIDKEEKCQATFEGTEPYGMIGLGKKRNIDASLTIRTDKKTQRESFENVPLDTLQDSWNDDSEGNNAEMPNTKFNTNLFISENENHSPNNNSRNSLSASMVSFGPPKPPRLFSSTPNLIENLFTAETKSVSFSMQNLDIDINSSQKHINAKQSIDMEYFKGINDKQNFITVAVEDLIDSAEHQTHSRDHSLQTEDNLENEFTLAEEDISFEDDCDILLLSDKNDSFHENTKGHISVIELPMYGIKTSECLAEDSLDVNKELNLIESTSTVQLPKNSYISPISLNYKASSFKVDKEIVETDSIDCSEIRKEKFESCSDSSNVVQSGNVNSGSSEIDNQINFNIDTTDLGFYKPGKNVTQVYCDKDTNRKTNITESSSIISRNQELLKNDLSPAMSKHDSDSISFESLHNRLLSDVPCIGTLGRTDTLHEVNEIWEANASIEEAAVNFYDSQESSESETFRNSSGDVSQRKVFFGDSKENVCRSSNETTRQENGISLNKEKLNCNASIATSFVKKSDVFEDNMLQCFLDFGQCVELDDTLLKEYFQTSTLTHQQEDLELLVRKLRILLNSEYMQNSNLNKEVLDWKSRNDILLKQLENQELNSFHLQKEISKFNSKLNCVEYQLASSEHEKKFSSTCLNETMKQISSLEKVKEKLKIADVENLFLKVQLEKKKDSGKNIYVPAGAKPNHQSSKTKHDCSQTDDISSRCTECQTTILEEDGLRIVSVTNVENSFSPIFSKTNENFMQTSFEWNVNCASETANKCIQTEKETEAFIGSASLQEFPINLVHLDNNIDAGVTPSTNTNCSGMVHLGTQVDVDTVDSFCQAEASTENDINLIIQTADKSIATSITFPEYREMINLGTQIEVDNVHSYCQTEGLIDSVHSTTQTTVEISDSQCQTDKCIDMKNSLAFANETTQTLSSLKSCGSQTILNVENNSSQTFEIKMEFCDVASSTETTTQDNKVIQTNDKVSQEIKTEISTLTSDMKESRSDIMKSVNDLKETNLEIKREITEKSNSMKELSSINQAKITEFQNFMSEKLQHLESHICDVVNSESILTELETNKNILKEISNHIDNLIQLEQDQKLNTSSSLDILKENKSVANSIRTEMLEIPKEINDMFSRTVEKLNSDYDEKISNQTELLAKGSVLVQDQIAHLDSKLKTIEEDNVSKKVSLSNICENVQCVINYCNINPNILCKLSENEKYLQDQFQHLKLALEETTTQSDQTVAKNLKFLIGNVDETVAENFQIVLNFLNNFEEKLISKVNETRKDEMEAKCFETSVISKKLESLQSAFTALRTAFDSNSELASNSVFDTSIVEAIRGGNDQALTSLKSQNETVLKYITDCKGVLDEIIANQKVNTSVEEYCKLENHENIKEFSSEKKIYDDKIEVLEAKCQMLQDLVNSKSKYAEMENEQKMSIENKLLSLSQEHQIMKGKFLNLQEAHGNSMQRKSEDVCSVSPQNIHKLGSFKAEVIVNEENYLQSSNTTQKSISKIDIFNMERSARQLKEENVYINEELKRVHCTYTNERKEYLNFIQHLKTLNEANESRISELQKQLMKSELSANNKQLLSDNLENDFFKDFEDLKASSKAVESALKVKRKLVVELKSQVSELELEKGELESDINLKSSLLLKCKRDCVNQQKTITELKQNLHDQANNNIVSQELEHKLSELQNEISNKHSLVLSLRERVSGLAQEKLKLVNELSLKQVENINAEVLLKEKEEAVKTSNELKNRLENISRNLNDDFIPKSKLNAFYRDAESYIENVLSEKKLQWSTITNKKLQAQEQKIELIGDREMFFKNEVKSLHEEVKLLKSKLSLTDRNCQLWRSRYNQLFDEFRNISQVDSFSLSKNNPNPKFPDKIDSKRALAQSDDAQFQSVLGEIDHLLKTPFEDSLFLNLSQSFIQSESSVHHSSSDNSSKFFSSTVPSMTSNQYPFLDSMNASKKLSFDIAERDSGLESSPRVLNSSFDASSLSPSVHKSYERYVDFLKSKFT